MNKGKSAEKYVEHFANTAYLKQWCYPNPKDEKGSEKEICDLLILFKMTCIIISIKNYELKGNYERFQKKVIEKSTKQLYGAESYSIVVKFTSNIQKRVLKNLKQRNTKT